MLFLFLGALIANPLPTAGDLLDCLDDRVPLVSAHRGGPEPGYPENALETFRRTVAAGPILIETDVRRTRDGELVLLHDATLDRTTTGKGRLADHPWSEVARLRLRDSSGAPTPFAPPRLRDALEWARGRTLLQLDVKEPDTLPAIAAAVRAAKAQAYVILILYTADDAVRAAAVAPGLTLNVTVRTPEDLRALTARVPVSRLTAFTGTAQPRPALWRQLDWHGVPVGFGTLGARDLAIAMGGSDRPYADLGRQGVDIIATARPQAALAAVDQRGRTARALKACGALGGRGDRDR